MYLQATAKSRDGSTPIPRSMANHLVKECAKDTRCKMVIEAFIDHPRGKDDIAISMCAKRSNIPTVLMISNDEAHQAMADVQKVLMAEEVQEVRYAQKCKII